MKAILICNGPTIQNINNYKNIITQYNHLIAVNRWQPIFKKFNLPMPSSSSS